LYALQEKKQGLFAILGKMEGVFKAGGFLFGTAVMTKGTCELTEPFMSFVSSSHLLPQCCLLYKDFHIHRRVLLRNK
jgi:hypothetical protein